MIMISNFLFNFINFCVIVSFLTKLLTLSILFSPEVRAAVVAKSVILGILLLIYFILALARVLVAKLVISVILPSIFFILALYTSLLTTSFFTTSLSLIKSTGTGTNLSTSNLSTLLFKLFQLFGTFFNLSISNLSTLDFKLAFQQTLIYQHLLHFLNLL